MNYKTWLKATVIRAARTMAQTFAALIGTSALVSDVNWGLAASTTILAGMRPWQLQLLRSYPKLKNKEGLMCENFTNIDSWLGCAEQKTLLKLLNQGNYSGGVEQFERRGVVLRRRV